MNEIISLYPLFYELQYGSRKDYPPCSHSLMLRNPRPPFSALIPVPRPNIALLIARLFITRERERERDNPFLSLSVCLSVRSHGLRHGTHSFIALSDPTCSIEDVLEAKYHRRHGCAGQRRAGLRSGPPVTALPGSERCRSALCRSP